MKTLAARTYRSLFCYLWCVCYPMLVINLIVYFYFSVFHATDHLQTSHSEILQVRKIFKFVPLLSGARFSKVPRTFRARKAIRKTTTYLFCKVGLLICCKGNKNKNNCKVSFLETPSFWRYKENYVTRKTPEKCRDFRETGPRAGWFKDECHWANSRLNIRLKSIGYFEIKPGGNV